MNSRFFTSWLQSFQAKLHWNSGVPLMVVAPCVVSYVMQDLDDVSSDVSQIVEGLPRCAGQHVSATAAAAAGAVPQDSAAGGDCRAGQDL